MVNNIISQIKNKVSNSGYETFYLGPEQKYVGALKNSNVNNLEEQYLMGVDSYTETWEDEDGNTIIETSFHKNNVEHENAVDYYKLVSCIYKSGTTQDDQYYFEGNAIKFPYAPQDVLFGNSSNPDYPDEKVLYMINQDIFYLDNNDKLRIVPRYAFILREDKLHYISENKVDTLISIKTTLKTNIVENGIVKDIITESIVNYL